ncbi:hypothetical protein GSI_04430 [Ganoderma sinense ZZ0214-1]|uniref:Uncharacterized protein n=1 Tax=Ganoderma sinense ZZ0214-1 TaxID=1077348 RepID=A0A2G8SJ47_9APHY|nr:hypothetical protein GSI_04430 [Ganoderma sinense ZZ0214-1]
MNPFPAGQPGSEKGSQIEAHLASPYSGPPGYSAIVQPSINVIPQDRPRNAYRRRFWHLLACTFFLLCVLYVLQNKHPNLTQSSSLLGPDQCADHVTWQEVPDVPLGYRAHLRTSVTLPVAENIISVIAEGARIQGSLEVSQTADAGSDAVVDVDVFYRNEENFNEATVCVLHPTDNEWGLGIFTPLWNPPSRGDPFNHLRFVVHLRLPAATSTSPLTIVQLKTDLRNFSQQLRALADTVYIDTLSLKSTNGRIVAESVKGDHLKLHTTNAAITGHFNTAADLDLFSTNGHIDAKVSLLPALSDVPASLSGPYHVSTQTSNAAIDLAFVDAPLDYALTASARTSNSRVDVTMHETFEGAFDLSTTNARAPTVNGRNGRDPAGRGRTRGHVVRSTGRTAVHGNVWWSEENKERGSVWVSTSNGGVRLTV